MLVKKETTWYLKDLHPRAPGRKFWDSQAD